MSSATMSSKQSGEREQEQQSPILSIRVVLIAVIALGALLALATRSTSTTTVEKQIYAVSQSQVELGSGDERDPMILCEESGSFTRQLKLAASGRTDVNVEALLSEDGKYDWLVANNLREAVVVFPDNTVAAVDPSSCRVTTLFAPTADGEMKAQAKRLVAVAKAAAERARKQRSKRYRMAGSRRIPRHEEDTMSILNPFEVVEDRKKCKGTSKCNKGISLKRTCCGRANGLGDGECYKKAGNDASPNRNCPKGAPCRGNDDCRGNCRNKVCGGD